MARMYKLARDRGGCSGGKVQVSKGKIEVSSAIAPEARNAPKGLHTAEVGGSSPLAPTRSLTCILSAANGTEREPPLRVRLEICTS
jgi:hypothetical protein